MNLSEAKLERKVNEKHTRNIREANEKMPESKQGINFSGDFPIVTVKIVSMFFIFLIGLYYNTSPNGEKYRFRKNFLKESDKFLKKEKYIDIRR